MFKLGAIISHDFAALQDFLRVAPPNISMRQSKKVI
jgi:hypothetical protein